MNRSILAVASLFLGIGLADVAIAMNRVVIQDASGACNSVDIRIHIENDVDLQALSLPLVVREVTPAAFIQDSVVMLPRLGRLATTLSDLQFLDMGNINFVTPDQFRLHFESLTAGADCLPAGPLEHMITLRVGLNGIGGIFEVDSMSLPPCATPWMVHCGDLAPIPLDQFQKGYVDVLLDGHVLIDFQSDPVAGTAGDLLQNQTVAIDPEGDPLGYYLMSGPGEVNPTTGTWTWESCHRDSGSYNVRIQVYQAACGPGNAPFGEFQVQVYPRDPADLNCDGVADAVDLAISIDHIFFGQNIPPCD